MLEEFRVSPQDKNSTLDKRVLQKKRSKSFTKKLLDLFLLKNRN